jgi:hypothetical protein
MKEDKERLSKMYRHLIQAIRARLHDFQPRSVTEEASPDTEKKIPPHLERSRSQLSPIQEDSEGESGSG